MVDEKMCAACGFNSEENQCKRNMTWMWRGEVSPARRSEYESIRQQCESEMFPGEKPGDPLRPFHGLAEDEKDSVVRKRLDAYTRKVYKRTKDTLVGETLPTHIQTLTKSSPRLLCRCGCARAMPEGPFQRCFDTHARPMCQVDERTSTVCQRENAFYINTVRNFRDRRYVYKGKLKDAQKDLKTVCCTCCRWPLPYQWSLASRPVHARTHRQRNEASPQS
jgi:DNA polymerase epsilon subunit 1